MTKIGDDIDWSLTTWEGARRQQLRRALRLTLRERLQGVEDMADLVRYFNALRDAGKLTGPATEKRSVPPTKT